MDIYDIISRSLLHRLDEGEQQQLDQWLAEDEGHLRLYQSFLAKKDLVEQYHKYQAFDEEQGWKKLAPLLDKPAKLHLIYMAQEFKKDSCCCSSGNVPAFGWLSPLYAAIPDFS